MPTLFPTRHEWSGEEGGRLSGREMVTRREMAKPRRVGSANTILALPSPKLLELDNGFLGATLGFVEETGEALDLRA